MVMTNGTVPIGRPQKTWPKTGKRLERVDDQLAQDGVK